VAKESGYNAVGLWYDCVEPFISQYGMEKTSELVKRSGLNIVELTFRQPCIFMKESEKENALAKFEELCIFAKKIDADFICLPAYGNKNEERDDGLKNFIKLCDIAENHGLKIGIENLPWSLLNTPKSAYEFVKLSECDNAEILIDAFQFFKSGSDINELEKIPKNKIVIVHMRDSSSKNEKLDLITQAREYGLFPGEGDFDLVGLVRKLKQIGYQGYYSLEVLNKDLNPLNAKEIALRDYQSVEKILKDHS